MVISPQAPLALFFLIDSINQIDGVLSEGYSSCSKNAGKGTSENRTSAPPTEDRLKSFGRAEKKLNPFLASTLKSMAKVEPNLGFRVKFLKLGIQRRVLYPFLLFVMCTRRRRIPSYNFDILFSYSNKQVRETT